MLAQTGVGDESCDVDAILGLEGSTLHASIDGRVAGGDG